MATLEEIMDYINFHINEVVEGSVKKEDRMKYINTFLEYVEILDDVIDKTEDLKYGLWRCIKLLNRG